MNVPGLIDPLAGETRADRVYYATGALLSADDFNDEQTYHRARLAQALAFLAGTGTLAGLRVDRKGTAGVDEEIVVRPGLALDRLGRLVEVPRDACIRVDRWLAAFSVAELSKARDTPLDDDGNPGLPRVVADVFVRFVPCGRGKQPAFATGPFDATDYAVPSRVRDGYALDLLLQKNRPLPLPEPSLEALEEQDPQKRRRETKDAILAWWSSRQRERDAHGLVPLKEHQAGQDATSVLLARITIAMKSDHPDQRSGAPVDIDNYLRNFAFAPPALARSIGL